MSATVILYTKVPYNDGIFEKLHSGIRLIGELGYTEAQYDKQIC